MDLSPLLALPPGNAVRIVIVAATIAMASFGAAGAVELRAGRRLAGGLAIAVLVASLATGTLGRLAPGWHGIGSFLTLALALGTITRCRKRGRDLMVLGVCGWGIAILAADQAFG
ncbi:MAG: hypothetical protein AAF533_25065 [Acidobacteriota bacterium]